MKQNPLCNEQLSQFSTIFPLSQAGAITSLSGSWLSAPFSTVSEPCRALSGLTVSPRGPRFPMPPFGPGSPGSPYTGEERVTPGDPSPTITVLMWGVGLY